MLIGRGVLANWRLRVHVLGQVVPGEIPMRNNVVLRLVAPLVVVDTGPDAALIRDMNIVRIDDKLRSSTTDAITIRSHD